MTSSMRGPGRRGGVETFADEDDGALLGDAFEHRMRVGHDAIEEAAVQLVHVGADDDEEVGAVARLGERGHDPAARLHDVEVAVLAFAQRVIDDAAGAVGERQDGAGAGDVGGHAAVERQLGLANEPGGGLHRLLEADLARRAPGAWRREADAGSRRWRGGSRCSTLSVDPVRVTCRSSHSSPQKGQVTLW